MSGYTPLFDSLTTGSLCGKWPDIGLWGVILSMSDQRGIVDVTHTYIAKVTGLPVEEVRACMRRFCEPDPESRSTNDDGRRLESLSEDRDWGWRVINKSSYREKARKQAYDSDRTASGRDAERKSGQRQVSREVPRSPDASREVPPSDTDTDTDTDTESDITKNPPTPQGGKPASPAGMDPALAVNRIFDHWRTTHGHPKAVLDKKRRALINAALKNYDEQTLKDCISGYRNSPHHQGINERNTTYDTIDLILKDAKHIDMGLKFFATPRTKNAPAKSSREIEWERVRSQAKLEGFREPRVDEPLKEFETDLAKHSHKVAVDRMNALAGTGDALKKMEGA